MATGQCTSIGGILDYSVFHVVWEVPMTLPLFGPNEGPSQKPTDVVETSMSALITVKAAPNPSTTYGETVCVAGLRIDPDDEGWVRLYPISFRDLERDEQFKKYQVVNLRAVPSRQDRRIVSWRRTENPSPSGRSSSRGTREDRILIRLSRTRCARSGEP